ncbi:TonB-dependent receptor-like protein [Blastomonas natatoria]|uniref:TonB-dependent receptor-like protein n=1 Tax=Blastomonas natatoria TaxID=34015 RepID=A0A2V3VAM6_9SPHN|nr:TonB-dependent receptor [Blastomonas natatoria]PXW78194.1 TonB-dependent receptor-like protein [Blastomonas natatoria]
MSYNRYCNAINILAAVAAISVTAPAYAQQAGLQINVVNNETGAPVANAEVTIENADIGLKRVVRSDDFGRVRLEALATSGLYNVSVAAAEGYDAASAGPVSLRSNFTGSVTIRVGAKAASDIVVTGTRAVTGINTVNAEVSSSLPREALTALPIEGRDVIQALIRLPNVVASTGFFPEAPVVSINGANGLETNYLIDGLDNNENFLGGPKFPVPLGFTKEVTVLANSYSVEFGRTANGIINYTSPSGTNDLTGEVYTLIRPGRPLDARSAFPRRDLTGNPVGESFERYQGGFAVGGPIVKDKTFFYASFEYTRDKNNQLVDAPQLGVTQNVTGNNEFLLGSLRLDHRFNDELTATLRGNFGRVTIERPGGGLGGGNNTFPSAGSDEFRPSTIIVGSLNYAGEDWTYDGSLQYSRFRFQYARTNVPAGPQVSIQDQTGLGVGTVGHPGFVFNDIENTFQTVQRLQRRFGNHRVKIGVDYIRSNFDLLGGGNPDGNFTVTLTPAQLATLRGRNLGLNLSAQDVLSLNPVVNNFSVELRPQSFGTSQNLLAFYLEDEWQVTSKLTATAGLRWDYDSLTGKGGKGGDYDNFAPRLALNFRPDSRSSIRFGAGLFYSKIIYAVISDALQRNTTSPAFVGQLRQLATQGIIPADTDLARVTFDGNLTVSPACATVSACPPASAVQALRNTAIINEARTLNPLGYDSPYSLQLSGGYQYQVSDTITASIDLIYSRTRNLVRLRDLNSPTSFVPNAANLTAANIATLRGLPDNAARLVLAQQLGLVRSQAAADATRPVGLVAGGARQITVSETEGKSLYRAVNLQVNKVRGDDDYAFRLSYTLSKLTNNTDDINFRASNANDFSVDNGPSANDRRHVISAVGFLYPIRGLTATGALLFQSGQPVNLVPDGSVFGTQDLNGDGQSFGENFVGNSDRFPGATRNSARLPSSTTVDIGLRYAVPVFGGNVEVSADVFNLFNANNQSGFANAASTSNQIQFGGGAPFVQRNAGPPRQFQFGLAYKF